MFPISDQLVHGHNSYKEINYEKIVNQKLEYMILII